MAGKSKGTKDQPAIYDPGQDFRLDFIFEFVTRSFKIKIDKWLRLLTTEEFKKILYNFLDEPACLHISFTLTTGGILQVSDVYDTPLRTKSCFFIKKDSVPMAKTEWNFKENLIFGELPGQILQHLVLVTEEIINPTIKIGISDDKWPPDVVADPKERSEEVQNALVCLKGLLRGKTWLPWPDKLETTIRSTQTDSLTDTEIKREVENLVMKWSQQIGEVLKRDSSELFDDGKNPTPADEIRFWRARLDDLISVHSQLTGTGAHRINEILEASKSRYLPYFKSLVFNVKCALDECSSIVKHFQPLRRHLEAISAASFDCELSILIGPLMHSICLLWAYSTHYRQSVRIISLLRQVCNLLIDMSRNFLNGSLIFQLEPEEASAKLDCVSDILATFKERFHAHRLSIGTYFEPDKPVHQWDFYPNLFLTRFESFSNRVEKLKSLFQTAVEFSKLEKTEIGGSQGKKLSAEIQEIHEEFIESFQKFSTIVYDCCDPENNEFDIDSDEFGKKAKTLDYRICCVLANAMKDCHTSESSFKLILVFTPLLERPLIKETFCSELPNYVQLIQNQITQVIDVFQEQILKCPHSAAYCITNRHSPPFSSIIHQVNYLRDRLDTSISQFQSLELSDQDLSSTLKANLRQQYEEARNYMKDFQDDIFQQWLQKTNNEAHIYLENSVLTRLSRTEISANLHNSLAATLKEVKYLKAAGYADIPVIAIEIFQRRQEIRKNFLHLCKISASYKQIYKGEDGNSLNPVEQSLLQTYIQTFEELIEQGVSIVKWSSPNLWNFIHSLILPLQECEEKLRRSRHNWKQINLLIESCNHGPLYIRKGNNRYDLLDMEGNNQRVKNAYAHTKSVSEQVASLSEDSKLALVTAEVVDHHHLKWEEYLKEIEKDIILGLSKVVSSSLGYFLDQTDEKLTASPFMEVSIFLENGVSFHPGLHHGADNEFIRNMEAMIDVVFCQASHIARLGSQPGSKNYEGSVRENPDLAEMWSVIKERALGAVTEVLTYSEELQKYDHVWNRNREKYLYQFLKYSRELSSEEEEQSATTETEDEIPLCTPSILYFKAEIDKYKSLAEEIECLPREKVFKNWFRMNLQPFVEELLNHVEKWGLMFKHHLIDNIVGSLSDLEEFIEETELKLSVVPVEGDLQSLIEIMGTLQRIKSRSKTSTEMFEPLKETIELLKNYDYEPPETVFIQLEELPIRWQALLKISASVKAAVAPLQNNEVASIKRRILAFDVSQVTLREAFQQMEFLDVNCPFPYDSIDVADKMVGSYETEFDSILAASKLFEVSILEPKILLKCRREIRFSKLLWDYILIVDAVTDDWKMTPWRRLDTENMDLECKRMAKEVKAMDKDIKSWSLFVYLESIVRHIASSLKSVGELQNPNIKKRHWDELLKGTKILEHLVPFLVEKFSEDVTTPLADLYSLGLHNYEEEVKNVVDKAVKESSIEKTLKELNTTWAVQVYTFEIHAKTGLKLVKVPEEVVQILEENQVQLQTIAMSKYISFFKDEVKYWQNLLGHADKVLTTILEIQRTWCHLESIFKSSEDIRMNLPEDSARFDKLDDDFRIALSWLVVTTNVIEGTSQERVYPEISRLQVELSCCEKAVSDYLETKRLKFPRFYFVSSADLLEILSTNNEPLKVMRHLPKLFDSVASLLFTPESEDTADRKDAHSMKSKDGELVPLKRHCLCFGQVEDWLGGLEDSMRSCVRDYMEDCVHAYGDKSRENWIRDFPAQVALCGTQIWWNNEVNTAFAGIEDGTNENALKEYYRKQVGQLNALISLLVGELTVQDRQKIMTICTIDVHSRDVVGKLIQMRVETSRAFQWQSQLRHRWDQDERDCFANICDAQLRYLHEFLGNTPRLVITPLTDRCYITLTQSVHLIMGGAPAGPAGTGKTETTKDLGRALGIMVYVFNCSEQMDYCSIGSIFKGLSMTGAWGCFDEFNRISVEVLSVVAVQVKSIHDAIRERKVRYNFMGEEIGLVSSVGIFITMNPGYAGRSELPENLKVLFRPCAMVVPDFELICEIMLVAEGFQEARILARKFITLYTLCKELLSKQDHYDWGLRAIKSVLVVAGSLKRADSSCPESEVLMRALRDFNIPKIISDDIPVFMGLIGDLFPALDVPRRRDAEFENTVKKATKEMLLQPEENFLLKVVQLQELMNVRHSVFIVGNAGTGKTQVWKTLFFSYKIMGLQAIYSDLNPKAVTSDELFGIINPATREWKDGIFSVLMREQANMISDGPKWIVLDGDIDPMWIESLNTVMDDNKILTLASNERIPLTKNMRLLFEIHTLKCATPATVSRAGILYLNPQDLNWNVHVLSWLSKRNDQAEVKTMLMQLFDKYVPSVMEQMRLRFKKIIPIAEGRPAGLKTLSNISDKKSSKWFTDMVHLPRIAKFIVPTGERELQFYDTATYDPYCQITQLYSVPIHIDAKLTHNMSLIIVMGDMQGCVTVLMVDQAISVLRNWSQQRRVNSVPTIAIHDAVGTQQGVKYAKFKVHDDMISCIHYCTTLNRVVTASISQSHSLVMGTLLTTWTANEMMESMTTNFVEGVSDLGMKPKRRKPADEVIFPISQGCRTFDIWEEKKWLAAGGLDRLVWVWNMYVPSQPVAKLRGHNAALFKVIFDPRSETLFSICTEKTIRIWQLLTNTCIHTLDVKGSKIKGQILHCFSPTTDGILIQTNDDCQYLRIARSGDETQEEGTSHADGITAICYNPQHEFIMSCSSEDILVWECETGKCVAEFNTIGGDGSMHLDTIAEKKDAPMEDENIFIMPLPIVHGREQIDDYEVGTVTCVTLDNMGRRFFTAHANGVIKAWNFYNGRNLYNLYKPLDNNDICDMHYITVNAEHRYLMTVGWDRRVVVYIDTQGPEVVHQLSLPEEPIEFTHDSMGHRDDIWACTFGYPNLIASGDYSGRLLVWNINSGHIVGYLKTNAARDRAYAKDKFITSLVFHTQTVKGKKTTYLVSSGPYHLMHMWRANTTRELNVGSVGWTRPCDLPRDYVTCIKTVPENNLIVCADTWGCVSVWTIEDSLGEKEPTEWFPKHVLRHGKDTSGFKPVGTYEVARSKKRAKDARSNLASATSVNSVENVAPPTTDVSSAALRTFIDTENPVYSFNISKLASKFGIALKNEEEELEKKRSTQKKEDGSASSIFKKKPASTQTLTLELTTSGGEVEITPSATQSRRLREVEKEKNRMTEFVSQRDHPETLSVRSMKRKKGYGLGPVQMKFIRSWKCHVDGFASLEVCNTYGLIVTGSKDRSVRVWDFEGQYIGVLGQPDQWLIGDPTTYAPMFPQDVILDVKRIRALEFFRKPAPPPLEAEVKAEEHVRAMLQQAEQRKMTDLDITGKSSPYEKLLSYDVPTTLWIQNDAPVGSYKKSSVDKQQGEIPYNEGSVPKRRGQRWGSMEVKKF